MAFCEAAHPCQADWVLEIEVILLFRPRLRLFHSIAFRTWGQLDCKARRRCPCKLEAVARRADVQTSPPWIPVGSLEIRARFNEQRASTPRRTTRRMPCRH